MSKMLMALVAACGVAMVSASSAESEALQQLQHVQGLGLMLREYRPSPDVVWVVHVRDNGVWGETLALTYGGLIPLDVAAREAMLGRVKLLHDVWGI